MPKKRQYIGEETVTFSVRFPVALRERIEERGNENQRSVNQEIIWLIKYALDQVDKVEKLPDKKSPD